MKLTEPHLNAHNHKLDLVLCLSYVRARVCSPSVAVLELFAISADLTPEMNVAAADPEVVVNQSSLIHG